MIPVADLVNHGCEAVDHQLVNVPMERVVECFRTPKFMRSLNDNVVKADIPYEKGNLRVIHMVVKMPGPVSNR